MVQRKRLTREESRAETRRRLLEAAERVFAEKGFAGASVEEIAETAGFSRGAFYSNFADKDELFLGLIEARGRAMADEIARLAAESANAADFFTALRRRAGGKNAERSWIMLSLEFWLYALREPKVARRLAELERAERDAYARVIEAQFADLGVDPPLPLPLAALIVQVLERGLVIQHHLDPRHVPADVVFDSLGYLLSASAALAGADRRPPRLGR